jgi:mRNA interferase RelE/StbE
MRTRRVGKPLRRELAGIWSARRGSYRVLCEIDEAKQRVVVLRIDHRADICRP